MCRVDEDADHQRGVLGSGLPDQGEVAFVEVAHGGYEANRRGKLLPYLLHLGNCFNNFHSGFVLGRRAYLVSPASALSSMEKLLASVGNLPAFTSS
ncbi:hypothetical protein ES703_27148 [subsurface metagenome]